MLRRFQAEAANSRREDFGESPPRASIWIAVEGVYSMDGDLAPLPEIAAWPSNIGAFLVVDDAARRRHSRAAAVESNTISPSRRRRSSRWGLWARPLRRGRRLHRRTQGRDRVSPRACADVSLFHLAFDCQHRRGLGGFRYYRTGALASRGLHRNVSCLAAGLREIGLDVADRDSGIIGLSVPPRTDLRKLALKIHNRDIDIATVEPPVVPLTISTRGSTSVPHTRSRNSTASSRCCGSFATSWSGPPKTRKRPAAAARDSLRSPRRGRTLSLSSRGGCRGDGDAAGAVLCRPVRSCLAKISPLPLGEGQGVRAARRKTPQSRAVCPAPPSPWPSPKGEGTNFQTRSQRAARFRAVRQKALSAAAEAVPRA